LADSSSLRALQVGYGSLAVFADHEFAPVLGAVACGADEGALVAREHVARPSGQVARADAPVAFDVAGLGADVAGAHGRPL
jgi:hypothetical protein